MTTYFVNCKNLDELKKAYKAAAMKGSVKNYAQIYLQAPAE